MVADEVQNHVVTHPAGRKVVGAGVDDMVGSEGANEIGVAFAVHRGDFASECSCDLRGEGTDAI
jgi:hypothetical protein